MLQSEIHASTHHSCLRPVLSLFSLFKCCHAPRKETVPSVCTHSEELLISETVHALLRFSMCWQQDQIGLEVQPYVY